MKILYAAENYKNVNDIIKGLKKEKVEAIFVDTETQVLNHCSTSFFDVILIDNSVKTFNVAELLKEIRNRQIYTPITVIVEHKNLENVCAVLNNGADVCIEKGFDIEELLAKLNALVRRNTIYQSPNIYFEGISLHKSDGKITYGTTSLSVSPIEIELFRLLTRASTAISINKLSKKIKEPADKIMFFAECLQKKIWLLNCPIVLDIKNEKYRLIKK